MRAARDLPYLTGIALGIVVAALAGVIGIPPLAAHGDFAEAWAGGRALLSGVDPYDAARWPAFLAAAASRTTPVPVFVYPPPVAYAIVPLALLPLPLAAVVWLAGGVLLAALALRALLRAVVPDLASVHALAGFALLASGPSLVALAQGQWDFIFVALLAAAVVSIREGRGRAAGALAIAALAKPQLVLFADWGLARAAAARRERAFFTSALAALAALSVLVAATWHAWAAWTGAAFAGFVVAPPVRAATLAGSLAALAGPAGAAAGALLALSAPIMLLRLDARRDAFLAAALALSIALAPYAQAYDQLLLAVPAVLAAGVARESSPRAAVWLFAAIAATLVLVSPILYAAAVEGGADLYGAFVPLAVAVVIVASLRQRP